MAKLVYAFNQSLDGYVDHMKLGAPAPGAFRHFIELVRGLTGLVYGSRTYEIMRYWDAEQSEGNADHHDFAACVAEQAEVGRLALPQVRRTERHTGWG